MNKERAKSFGELIDFIDKFFPNPNRLKKSLDKSLFVVGKNIISDVKKIHEWKDRSGLLNKSHYVKKARQLSIELGNKAPYARYLHDGTGIYGYKKKPIVPKVAKYLKFKIGNRWISTKSVKGIKPMRWLNKGWESYLPETTRIISETIFKEVGL